MKSILCFIGSALYGAIIPCLLWLLFYSLVPWLMSFGWTAVILYWIFAFGLIVSLLGGIFGFAYLPLLYMTSKCKAAKIIPILSTLFFGYCSIVLPWKVDIDYSLVKIVIAISLTFTILALYITSVKFLIKDVYN